MQICQAHWAKLKAAIVARGLDRLSAHSGEDAAAKLVSEVESGPTKTNFDPLMGAHNAILSNALSVAGLALMTPNDDGTDKCPICFLLAGCQCGEGERCAYNSWADRAADDMRAAAIALGVLPSS